MRIRTRLLATAAFGLSMGLGAAAADTLTIGLPTAPTSLDPLFQQIGSNHEITIHKYDTLIFMDELMTPMPGLAVSWEVTGDPAVWEIRLREGASFHNGEPFGAEDVAYSMRRALDVPGAPSTYSRVLANVLIEDTEVVHDLAIRVRTDGPFPLLPRMLSNLPIVSRAIGEGAMPGGFNDGTLAVGTGPYMFERFEPGDRVVLVPNPDYWGEPPIGERVVIRFIESGPLRDLRVRQAINMAMDRDLIVEQVMNGLAIPTNQFVPEGFGGWTPLVESPEADLVTACRPMEEAGFGDGFRMTIHATNGRYVNDAQLAQAVAQMLARIGIKVEVVKAPVAGFFDRARNRELTFMMVGFAATSGEAISIMSPVLVSGSINNYGNWAHEEFTRLFRAALTTVDPDEHAWLLEESIVAAMEDVPMIPTHNEVVCWGARAGLSITPFSDEYTRADAFRPE